MIWETRDGRKIPLDKLADQHVVSAVRFFRARAATLAMAAPPKGELAKLKSAGRVFVGEQITARLRMIEGEAARRGLIVDEP